MPRDPIKELPEQLRVQEVYFLGEQDGGPERRLKTQLADLFRHEQTVTTAYLARVGYKIGGPASVALCLCTGSPVDEDLVARVNAVFASMFEQEAHLDIMFLDKPKELELSRVCSPFWRGGGRGT